MAYTNFVIDLKNTTFLRICDVLVSTVFWISVRLGFPGKAFVVNILLYLFLLYQELPQLQVSILVLGATFVVFRFPGLCILLFFQFL